MACPDRPFQPVDKVEKTGEKEYNEKGAENTLF